LQAPITNARDGQAIKNVYCNQQNDQIPAYFFYIIITQLLLRERKTDDKIEIWLPETAVGKGNI
jgi:hypothetical protein